MLTRGAWAVAALGGEDAACQAAGATEQRLPPTPRHRMRTATSSRGPGPPMGADGRLRPDPATLPPGSPLPGRSGLTEQGHGCACSPQRLRPHWRTRHPTWSPACVHPDASASGPPPETMPTSSPPVCNPPPHGALAVKAAEPEPWLKAPEPVVHVKASGQSFKAKSNEDGKEQGRVIITTTQKNTHRTDETHTSINSSLEISQIELKKELNRQTKRPIRTRNGSS